MTADWAVACLSGIHKWDTFCTTDTVSRKTAPSSFCVPWISSECSVIIATEPRCKIYPNNWLLSPGWQLDFSFFDILTLPVLKTSCPPSCESEWKSTGAFYYLLMLPQTVYLNHIFGYRSAFIFNHSHIDRGSKHPASLLKVIIRAICTLGIVIYSYYYC